MKKLLAACAAIALMGAGGSAGAVTLYSNNFDGTVVVDPLVGVSFTGFTLGTALSGPWNAQGWSGNYADNRSGGSPQGTASGFTTLTLTNLAPHTMVQGSFLLGFLESWDSNDGSCCSPDFLDVYIDSTLVATMTSNNALGSLEDYDGGTELHDDVQANTEPYFDDTLVNMAGAPFLSFAHTGSTLTLAFQARGGGWQGGSDEGFGIDSLVLTYDGVRPTTPGIPEPATWAMMILGFGAAGTVLRRRRGATAAA